MARCTTEGEKIVTIQTIEQKMCKYIDENFTVYTNIYTGKVSIEVIMHKDADLSILSKELRSIQRKLKKDGYKTRAVCFHGQAWCLNVSKGNTPMI